MTDEEAAYGALNSLKCVRFGNDLLDGAGCYINKVLKESAGKVRERLK